MTATLTKVALHNAYEVGYDSALREHNVAAVKLRGNRCEIHKEHRPIPLTTEVHHVWPLSMGGSDDETNTVRVCPGAHANVHELIRMLVDGEDLPSSGLHAERKLARDAFDAWEAAGRPAIR